MEEIKVEDIYRRNYFSPITTNEELQEIKDKINSLLEEIKSQGFIYVKITKGQKEGSIAKFFFNETPNLQIQIEYKTPPPYRGTKIRYNTTEIKEEGDVVRISLNSTQGYLKWTGKANKPKYYITSEDLVWLKGYVGNTVWNVKSSNDRKLEELSKPVYDLYKSTLNVGDNVIYINARYGSGMELSTGTIDRFEAEYHANTDTVSVYTIVKNEHYKKEESKISSPSTFIYKKEN